MAAQMDLYEQLVLIVEDEILIAMDLVNIIQDAGAAVIGPAKSVVEALRLIESNKITAAIVDVNDLGAVKVLAATSGVVIPMLQQALKKNPAGNADEQTPVVLIRPL